MANFTQKVGYEGKLDFDPQQGIIKYGNYEKFVDQIPEIKPQKQVINFASWKQNYVQSLQQAATPTGLPQFTVNPIQPKIPSDPELRAIFNSAFVTGAIPKPEPKPVERSIINGFNDVTPAFQPGFRKVTKLGADSFEVSDYAIPNDVKLLYKMNEYASGLSQVSEDKALMQEQAQTKQARRTNANASKGGAGAAMLGGSAASKALAGG